MSHLSFYVIRGEAANSKDHKAYAGEGIKKQNRITSSTHWFKSSPLFTGRRLYSLPPAQPFPSARENTRQGPKDTDAVPSVKKSKCTVLERVIDHQNDVKTPPQKIPSPLPAQAVIPKPTGKSTKGGENKKPWSRRRLNHSQCTLQFHRKHNTRTSPHYADLLKQRGTCAE